MTATGQAVVNYAFDNNNRLTQVAQGTTTLGFGYDAASRRTSVTLPNGIVGTYGFDNGNELTGITYASGSTQIGTLTYGYDLGGRRTSVGGTLAGFVPPAYVAAMSYDGTNRLTSLGGTSLSYDADGNLTGFGATTYSWNSRNQMTATSAGSATFAYDALGRRVSATVNGATTTYLYDGVNPVVTGGSLMMASGSLDEIFAQVGSTTTTSFLRDGTNSTAALTSSTAAISANYAYSPYGDSAQSGAGGTAFQYTGRENDGGTGLYYYRARYYSPQLGRFVSEDPLGLGGGANFYAYAGGNPVTNSDPLGLFITSVDAACVMDPGFCAEIMGQMFQNTAALSGDACLQQFADRLSGQLRGLATLASILPIAVTEHGLEHVLSRHTVGGAKSAGKSLFTIGEDLDRLIQNANSVTPVVQAGGNFERVVDAGRVIGIDRATGMPTNIYTVITNVAGELVTMFPGLP